MGTGVVSFDWGMWVLGDLPELLSRAMDVLGASATVTAAHVLLPDEGHSSPEVHFEVVDREEAARLRGEVGRCEFIAHFEPDYGDPGWACRVAGLRLQVSVQEVA